MQAGASPSPAPQLSPLNRYQVPKTSKLPQTQADLAVYVSALCRLLGPACLPPDLPQSLFCRLTQDGLDAGEGPPRADGAAFVGTLLRLRCAGHEDFHLCNEGFDLDTYAWHCQVTHSGAFCMQQTRFQAMSDGIVGRIDELGSQIDELDKSITQLIDQTGMEAAASSPSRPTPSSARP